MPGNCLRAAAAAAVAAQQLFADTEIAVSQETWKALERAVDEGLVRSIGLSNFSPEKIEKWLGDARIKPAVNQVSACIFPYHTMKRSTVFSLHPCSSP